MCCSHGHAAPPVPECLYRDAGAGLSEFLVYKRKPPQLNISQYPNKIEVGRNRCYAILVSKSGARLQNAYSWMSTHPYIKVNYVPANGMGSSDSSQEELTGNIAIEAYESPERPYAMIAFRAATVADERTNSMMQPHGESHRRGPCPAPITGLLCRSGVNIQSVWQWLSLHRGRLAYLVNEQFIRNTIAIVRPSLHQSDLVGSSAPLFPGGASRHLNLLHSHHSQPQQHQPSSTYQYALYDEFNTRQARNLQGPVPSSTSLRHYLNRQLPGSSYGNMPYSIPRRHPSHESVDSALPMYEPPPPSVHSSIPEDIRAEIEAMEFIQAEEAQVAQAIASTVSCTRGASDSAAATGSGGIVSTDDEEYASDGYGVSDGEHGSSSAVGGSTRMDVDDNLEYLRIVPRGNPPPPLPPPYWEIAEQTEYGRRYTTSVSAPAFEAVDTEMQGAAAVSVAVATDTLDLATAPTTASSSSSSSSSSTSAESRGISLRAQSHQRMPSPSSYAVPATMMSAATAASLDNTATAAATIERVSTIESDGAALRVPSDTVSTYEEDEASEAPAAAEANAGTADASSSHGMTRTFTRSMPALHGLLSDEDTVAAIEESRRRAIAMGNRAAAADGDDDSIDCDMSAEATVVQSASLLLTQVPSAPAAASAFADGGLQNSASSTSGLHGRSNNSSDSTRRQQQGSSGSVFQGRILRGFNEHMRKSRLSAKTNPEYGARKSWISRLLNM
ncbi:hypothetical protein GQ54DRAFT_306247 [Martensiomyces pterosporus]|nr:hypothetical protein GQ54DRAFT_306247 [Martensiomyces pterosporus]